MRGVVVDEVQDLNGAGLRLVHRIAGDTPDGLLLIGEGQQSLGEPHVKGARRP